MRYFFMLLVRLGIRRVRIPGAWYRWSDFTKFAEAAYGTSTPYAFCAKCRAGYRRDSVARYGAMPYHAMWLVDNQACTHTQAKCYYMALALHKSRRYVIVSRIRCNNCRRASYEVHYCSWCGKRMSGYVKQFYYLCRTKKIA